MPLLVTMRPFSTLIPLSTSWLKVSYLYPCNGLVHASAFVMLSVWLTPTGLVSIGCPLLSSRSASRLRATSPNNPGRMLIRRSGRIARRGTSSPAYTAKSTTGLPSCSHRWQCVMYEENEGISRHHVLSRWKNVPMPSSVMPGLRSVHGLWVLTWKTMLLMPRQ